MVESLIRGIDKVTEAIGKVAIALSLVLVLVVVADVALRYFLNISFSALRELEWHFYAAMFLLGGAYTLRYDAHVRVDVLYQHMPVRMRALINVLGTLFFLFPGCYLLVDTSFHFAKFSFMMHEISPDPGGLPCRWILKGLIPFSFVLMAVQGVSFLLKNVLVLLGRREMTVEG